MCHNFINKNGDFVKNEEIHNFYKTMTKVSITSLAQYQGTFYQEDYSNEEIKKIELFKEMVRFLRIGFKNQKLCEIYI